MTVGNLHWDKMSELNAGTLNRYAPVSGANAAFEVDRVGCREVAPSVLRVRIGDVQARRQTLALLSDARMPLGSCDPALNVVMAQHEPSSIISPAKAILTGLSVGV